MLVSVWAVVVIVVLAVVAAAVVPVTVAAGSANVGIVAASVIDDDGCCFSHILALAAVPPHSILTQSPTRSRVTHKKPTTKQGRIHVG